MNRLLKVGSIAASCAIALANVAFTADVPNEGKYDYTTCFTRNLTQMEYSPTQSAWSYNERGTAVSNPTGGMFDGDVIQCVGMTASFDGKRYGNSACIAVAKDGATRLSRVWYDADSKLQRETVAGTGKYDGMVTTGTIQAVKEAQGIKPGAQTVEYCNRNVGTYKLNPQVQAERAQRQ
jgi:hypothetical protein